MHKASIVKILFWLGGLAELFALLSAFKSESNVNILMALIHSEFHED